MGEYGPSSTLVCSLVERAGRITFDEAFDLYTAFATRILLQGTDAERVALARARKSAVRSGLSSEYEAARQAAVKAWRRALPEAQGPWLLVGAAIANAAGALVVEGSLDEKTFQLLIGPWKQAIGTMTPVGPGQTARPRVHLPSKSGQLIG